MSDHTSAGPQAPLMPWETGSSSGEAEAAESLFGMLAPEGTTDSPDESVADEAEPDSEVEEVGDTDMDSEDGATEFGATDETDAEEDEEVEDEGEEVEEAEDEPGTFTVTVDGQEVEVTQDELLQGYTRTATFTQRMQQVAELRREIESERATIHQQREQYAERIAMFEQAIQSMQQEPDWDRLREEDPAEYAAQMADYQRRERQLALARAERQRMEAETQAEREQQLRTYLAEESQKLAEAIPEFKDPATAAAEKARMVGYAKEKFGFSDADLSQVYDHRVLVLLRKAMQWDELQSKTEPKALKKAKKVKNPKVLRPGSPKPPAKRGKVLAERKEQLTRTGRVDDAAAAILAMMSDD